jgi:hypothetical protein
MWIVPSYLRFFRSALVGPCIFDLFPVLVFRQNPVPEKGRFAVKRKRFSVEQIVAVLKHAEAGAPSGE